MRTRQNYSKARAPERGVWCRESKIREGDRGQVVKDVVNHREEFGIVPRRTRSL